MQQKDWIVGGVLVLALVVGLLGWAKPAQVIDATKVDVNAIAKSVYDAVAANLPLGGSGPVGNELVEFYAGFITRDNYATTTPGSATLSAKEAAGFSTVSFYPSVGDVTLTLPASTTLGAFLGPTAGSMKRVCYYNATTTTGIDITWASGTGVDLEIASTTSGSNQTSVLTTLADSSVCIEYQRKSSSDSTAANRNDVTARLTRYVDGD